MELRSRWCLLERVIQTIGMMDEHSGACMDTLNYLKRIIGQHGDMCDEVDSREETRGRNC